MYISLFTIAGEKVADLCISSTTPPGQHRKLLTLPENLATGKYIIQLNTENDDRALKVLITK